MKVLSALLVMSVILFAQLSSFAQTKNKKAAEWFKKGDWSKGLKLKPHASVDQEEFYKQYNGNKALWDTAFAFLREVNLDTIKPGKYPLMGDDVYVSITEGPTKEFSASKWESHKQYIDIQYAYRGKEKIGVYPSAKATVVTNPYDEKKDVANYDIKDGDFYVADPGTFFIFFPRDAHRPGIKVDGFDTVKKVVIKVHVAR